MGFPLEMNITGRPFGRPPAPTSNSTTALPVTPPPFLEAAVPRGFNFSEPYVEKPFPPFRIQRQPQPAFNLSSIMPWLPADAAKEWTEIATAMFEDMLKTSVPGIPKDFKFSNIYSPGGIVISEIEVLISGLRKASGVKNPLEGVFGAPEHVEGGHMHRVKVRSMYRD